MTELTVLSVLRSAAVHVYRQGDDGGGLRTSGGAPPVSVVPAPVKLAAESPKTAAARPLINDPLASQACRSIVVSPLIDVAAIQTLQLDDARLPAGKRALTTRHRIAHDQLVEGQFLAAARTQARVHVGDLTALPARSFSVVEFLSGK